MRLKNTLKRKKTVTTGHTVCDPAHMRCPGQANEWRQTVDERLSRVWVTIGKIGRDCEWLCGFIQGSREGPKVRQCR